MSQLDEQKKINAELEREIKLKERAKAIDEDRISLSSGLVDSIKETVGIKSRISTFDNNILKVNKEINKVILDQRKSYDDIGSLTKQISKNSDTIAKAEKVNLSLSSSLSKEGKKRLGYAKGNLTNISKLQKEQDDILAAAERGEKIDLNRLDAIQKEIGNREATLDKQIEGMSYSERQAFFSEQNLVALKKEQEARKAELKQKEEIEKKLGAFGGILKGISKIPLIGDLVDTDKILGAARDKVKETGSGVAGLGAGLKEAGKQVLDGITNPANLALAAFSSLGAAILSNNKKITDFERTLSLSEVEATLLAGEMAVIAATTDNINVSSKNLVKTFMALNEELGIASTNFTDDVLATSTILIENIGLAAGETANLAAAAQITGGNFEDQYKNALLATRTLQEQTGVQFNNKKILEEVGQVTGQIRANLGGNIEEIARAVTQAKLFGASLQEVADAGKNLLDFEQAITNELEAELLLGKDLNLERARAAALEGDLVTLGEELAAQAGSLADFQEMNVLQQEALASAMGMTSDQLADILFQQEVQGKTAQQLRALGKDELANRLEQQNAQESLNALVANFQSLLADLAKPLDFILQAFSGIVSAISDMKNLLLAVTGIQLVYLGYKKVAAALEAKELVMNRKNFFAELASMAVEGAKSVAKIPFVGPVLAIAALAGLYAAGKALIGTGDDVLSPGKNSSGYGDRMLFGPEGAISLNNKDTVIAGTDLFKGDDVVAAGEGQINIPAVPDNKEGQKTNMLLQQLITQNAKKPQISPVGLYEVQ